MANNIFDNKSIKNYPQICFRTNHLAKSVWTNLDDLQRDQIKTWFENTLYQIANKKSVNINFNVNADIQIDAKYTELRRQLKECKETIEILNSQIMSLKRISKTETVQKEKVKVISQYEEMIKIILELEKPMEKLEFHIRSLPNGMEFINKMSKLFYLAKQIQTTAKTTSN